MSFKVILTGSTGMVGRGVLLECLDSPEVAEVLVVNRHPLGLVHPKLREALLSDFSDPSPIADRLAGYQACFFCLGVSSAGMSEADYTRLTYTLTLGFAGAVARLNPGLTFCYVTGAGTDSTERGRVMWARVKGRTENALLRLHFKAAYMFRPGFIEPLRGVKSRTRLYAIAIAVFRPLFPLLRRLSSSTTSVKMGRAMIRAVTHGYPRSILEVRDINALAGSD